MTTSLGEGKLWILEREGFLQAILTQNTLHSSSLPQDQVTRCVSNVLVTILVSYFMDTKLNFKSKYSHQFFKAIVHIHTFEYHIPPPSNFWDSPRGVVVNVPDCDIIEREFELQSLYNVHFRIKTLGKGMNIFILPAMC